MPQSINQQTLGGHIVRVPDFYDTKNGKMATFTIALNDDYKAKDATEYTKRTYWPKVLVPSSKPYLVRACERINQGDYVIAVGKYTESEYTNKEGVSTRSWQLEADKIINFGSTKKSNDMSTHLDDGDASFDPSAF